jgi:MFS family permease
MLFLSPWAAPFRTASRRSGWTGAQFAIGTMFALIAVAIVTGWINIYLLAGATLVLGVMYAVMGPTRQAWVGDLLEGPALAHGVALQQLMMNATRIVGPLLAGALIAAESMGTAGAYFTMAALFGGVVLILAMMEPSPPRPRAEATSVKADLTEGFWYIWHARHPPARSGVRGHRAQRLLLHDPHAGLPREHAGAPGKPPWAAARVGRGGRHPCHARWPRQPSNPTLVMLGFGAALAGSLAILAIAPNFGLALAAGAMVGVCSSGFQMLNNVNLMERCDPVYFGRVMAVTMMAFGVNSIFAYPVGIVADQVGERATLLGLAVLCMGVVALGFLALRGIITAEPPHPHATEATPLAHGTREYR